MKKPISDLHPLHSGRSSMATSECICPPLLHPTLYGTPDPKPRTLQKALSLYMNPHLTSHLASISSRPPLLPAWRCLSLSSVPPAILQPSSPHTRTHTPTHPRDAAKRPDRHLMSVADQDLHPAWPNVTPCHTLLCSIRCQEPKHSLSSRSRSPHDSTTPRAMLAQGPIARTTTYPLALPPVKQHQLRNAPNQFWTHLLSRSSPK